MTVNFLIMQFSPPFYYCPSIRSRLLHNILFLLRWIYILPIRFHTYLEVTKLQFRDLSILNKQVTTPSEWNGVLWGGSPNGCQYSCQILQLSCHWILGSRHPKLSISFLEMSCHRRNGITSALIETQGLFYAHFKVNKITFLVTCHTNIFSTIMFSRSSDLTFNFVFLKMWYLIFWNEVLCACNCSLKHLQISSLDCSGAGFCEASDFTCIDEAT
jgi:hypothetical protein